MGCNAQGMIPTTKSNGSINVRHQRRRPLPHVLRALQGRDAVLPTAAPEVGVLRLGGARQTQIQSGRVSTLVQRHLGLRHGRGHAPGTVQAMLYYRSKHGEFRGAKLSVLKSKLPAYVGLYGT